MSEPDRSDAVRRLAAKDNNGLTDPEDMAAELGIGLFELTELVRRYQEWFDWTSVPLGKLRPRSDRVNRRITVLWASSGDQP